MTLMILSSLSTTLQLRQYPNHWLEPTNVSQNEDKEWAPKFDEEQTSWVEFLLCMGERPPRLPHEDPADNCQSVPHRVDIIGGCL